MSHPKLVKVTSVPAVGPYSQVVQAGNIFYCSGQIGIDPQTGVVLEGIEKQMHRVMKNIELVLSDAGLTLNNIAKTTIYLTNMGDFLKINEIYASYFKTHKPARATVGVNTLPKNVLVEIEAVAYKD